MLKLNYWAVVVAAFAAFVMSSLYYSPLLLGNFWRSVDPVAAAGMQPSMWKALAELARTFVITLVLAQLISMLGAVDWKGALRLAILLWFGFSALMWIGAIMWEKTPWPIAAMHSGDWLIKTVLIAVILGAWRRKEKFSARAKIGRAIEPQE